MRLYSARLPTSTGADLIFAGRLTTLEKQLASAQAEVERLTAAHDALQATNTTLATTVDELRTSLSSLSSSSPPSDHARALSTSLSSAQEAESAARRELESLRAEMGDLERSKREVEEELALCRGEVEETSSTLAAAMAELDSTKDEVTELEKAIDDAREEAHRAASARSALEQEKAALDDQVKSLRARLDEATASTPVLEEQVTSLRRQLKEKEEAFEQLETTSARDLEAANERVRELQSQLSVGRRQASKSERELKAIMAQDSDRANEVENLREAIARLEQEITRSRSAGTNGLKPSMDESALASELERKVNECEALRQELELQRERVGETEGALAELREMYARAQEELEEARSGGSASPPTVTAPAPPSLASSTEVDALQLELSAAQTKIRQLEQEIFSLDSARVKMLKANGDLKSQVESMMEALDQERAKTKAKELEIDTLKHRSLPSLGSPPPRPSPALAPPRTPSGSDASQRPQQPSAPVTPTRRGHSHRRTASYLPTVAESSDASLDSELAPLASPPLVPFQRNSSDDAASDPSHRAAHSRHIRQASLSLLKARMEDEYGVADLDRAGPLSPTREQPGLGAALSPRADKGRRTRRVPLSNDLVLCAACKGDDLFIV